MMYFLFIRLKKRLGGKMLAVKFKRLVCKIRALKVLVLYLTNQFQAGLQFLSTPDFMKSQK